MTILDNDLRHLEPGTLLQATFEGDLCVYKTKGDASDAHHPKVGEWIHNPPLLFIVFEDDFLVLLEIDYESWSDRTYGRVLTPYGSGWMWLKGVVVI